MSPKTKIYMKSYVDPYSFDFFCDKKVFFGFFGANFGVHQGASLRARAKIGDFSGQKIEKFEF